MEGIVTKLEIWLPTIALVVVGVIGTIVSIWDIFIEDPEKDPEKEVSIPFLPKLKDRNQIILLIVALLCFAIGFERLTHFDKLNQRLDILNQRLDSAISAEIVSDYDKFWATLSEYIQDAKNEINVLTFKLDSLSKSDANERAFQNTYNVLLKKLKSSKESHKSLFYHILLGYDISMSTPNQVCENIKIIEERKKIFQENNISDLVEYRYARIPTGLTLVIVDNKHLLIGFPKYINEMPEELQTAIKINNLSQVSSINEWFDRNLWNRANKTPPWQDKSDFCFKK